MCAVCASAHCAKKSLKSYIVSADGGEPTSNLAPLQPGSRGMKHLGRKRPHRWEMLREREAPVSATPSPDGADRTVPVPGSLSEIDQTWLLGVGQFGLSRSSDCFKRTMDVDGAAIGSSTLCASSTRRRAACSRSARTGASRSWVASCAGHRLTNCLSYSTCSRGEMNLVGPRPLVQDEDVLIEGWRRRRLAVKPGMTGQWQIFGSSRIPMQEMVKIDYMYGPNWSLWLDLKILLRTIPYKLGRRGL